MFQVSIAKNYYCKAAHHLNPKTLVGPDLFLRPARREMITCIKCGADDPMGLVEVLGF